MVTAETAVVIPMLAALTLALAWIVWLGIAQVRLVDAAREAARMTARGDSQSEVVQMAEWIAPKGADVEIDDEGEVTTVRVDVTVLADLPLVGDLGAVELGARSSSVTEGQRP